MHTKELARALRAFAAVADFDRSQELYRLAAQLDRGRNETIGAWIKHMSASRQHPGRLKETLDAIAEGLRAMGAVKASAEITELLKLFAGRPGATLDDFLAEISSPPASQGPSARCFKAANTNLANDICSELAFYIDDPEAFRSRLESLAVVSPAGTATWTIVANRLIGNNRAYRDRKAAIRAIKEHVEARALSATFTSQVEPSRPQ